MKKWNYTVCKSKLYPSMCLLYTNHTTSRGYNYCRMMANLMSFEALGQRWPVSHIQVRTLRATPISQYDICRSRSSNSRIKYLKNQVALRLSTSNTSTLRIRLYADAAFVTNLDCSSQLDFVILRCASYDSCHAIDISNKTSRSDVPSVTE